MFSKHNLVSAAILCSTLALFGCGQKPAQLANKKHIHFGTAITLNQISVESEAKFLTDNFNSYVAENAMKWQYLQPTKKFWNWSDTDAMADFAVKHNMEMRGHTLVWHSQNPGFVNNLSTKEEAIACLKDHIVKAMEHYRGKIYEWDVCNEIFDDDGSLRKSVWYKLIGPEYVDIAFQTAREADPDTRLVLNDYSNEEKGSAKADAMFEFVKSMKERGIPIDGVGFQLHLSTKYPYGSDNIRNNIRRYNDIGVRVSFTEIDVRMPLPAKNEDVEKQKMIYKDLMSMVLTEPNIDTYIIWGYTDKTSWVPRAFSGEGSAHPFDSNLNPKPLYHELVEMMK